ncbi:MAG: divergent polysaccharide deacetylase family protein [Proteobacteria bacterium]|nr:divergent polysaccharide deacetylase family protein [Pseudomonadota bacterium]MDA1355785.1 divergent polysaccharide deacetylase family protein [Pseudomonadota bacterium]
MNAPLAVFATFFIALLSANAFSWQGAEAAETELKSAVAVSRSAQGQVSEITDLQSSEIVQSELPDWRRYAAQSKESGEAPIIALVIDDLGHNEEEFVRVMALGEGITLAILPYTARAAEFAQRARQRGFEILVHMPMEPTDSSADPGPNALLINLGDNELMRRLSDNLARLAGYVGINNHMGSKFSQNRHAMSVVLSELEARGLLYLDSVTINSTIGARLAEASRMPFASRDVFLDNSLEKSFIEDQLRAVEELARETGRAVAIGHPHNETLAVLKRWLPDARKRGFEFVPISTIAALECAC